MSRCAIQRGVFALRPCPNAALMVCASCGRGACGSHLDSSGPAECSECAAKRVEGERQAQVAEPAARTRRRWRDDSLYGYGYRDWLWYEELHTDDDRLADHDHHSHDHDHHGDHDHDSDAGDIGDEAAGDDGDFDDDASDFGDS